MTTTPPYVYDIVIDRGLDVLTRWATLMDDPVDLASIALARCAEHDCARAVVIRDLAKRLAGWYVTHPNSDPEFPTPAEMEDLDRANRYALAKLGATTEPEENPMASTDPASDQEPDIAETASSLAAMFAQLREMGPKRSANPNKTTVRMAHVFVTLNLSDGTQVVHVTSEWDDGTLTIDDHDGCPRYAMVCNCDTYQVDGRTLRNTEAWDLPFGAVLEHETECGRLSVDDPCECPMDAIITKRVAYARDWIRMELASAPSPIAFRDIDGRLLVIPPASVVYADVDSNVTECQKDA